MKKTLLSIMSVFAIGTMLNAQVTVTSSNLANVGDVLYEAEDTIPNSSIAPGGVGQQTWDFSNVVAHTVKVQEFVNPATTPNGGDFTNSNLCMYLPSDTSYVYISKSASAISIDGMAAIFPDETTPTSMFKDPSELLISYPLNLNDNVSDSSHMEIIFGNYRMVESLTKEYTVDAWGQVTIPVGTYDVLRVSRTNITIQDLQMNVGGDSWTTLQTSIDTTYAYEWWTNDNEIKLIVCSFDWDIEQNVVDGEFVYYTEEPLAINTVDEIENINIYPNPTSGIFTIDGNNITDIQIIDVTGKIIYAEKTSKTISNIDLRDFSNGVYFVKVKTVNGISVKKLLLN